MHESELGDEHLVSSRLVHGGLEAKLITMFFLGQAAQPFVRSAARHESELGDEHLVSSHSDTGVLGFLRHTCVVSSRPFAANLIIYIYIYVYIYRERYVYI